MSPIKGTTFKFKTDFIRLKRKEVRILAGEIKMEV